MLSFLLDWISVMVFFFTYPKLNFLTTKITKRSCSHCHSYQETHSHYTSTEALHWLPVKSSITFKLLLYNISLVKAYTPVRSLRSSNTCMLRVTKSSKSWGVRSFSHAGATLWNDLPLQIRNISNINTLKV